MGREHGGCRQGRKARKEQQRLSGAAVSEHGGACVHGENPLSSLPASSGSVNLMARWGAGLWGLGCSLEGPRVGLLLQFPDQTQGGARGPRN